MVGADKAGHAGNALAAPESHIEGIIMSQYAAREGVGLEQIGHLRVGPAEQVPGGHDRENALESIHEEDQDTSLCTQHTNGVGGPGIPASVITDIDSPGLAKQICALDRAESIAD